MAGAAVPGHAGNRVIHQQRERNDIQIRQRAERGTGQKCGAAVSSRRDAGGDGAAQDELAQGIHRATQATGRAIVGEKSYPHKVWNGLWAGLWITAFAAVFPAVFCTGEIFAKKATAPPRQHGLA